MKFVIKSNGKYQSPIAIYDVSETHLKKSKHPIDKIEVKVFDAKNQEILLDKPAVITENETPKGIYVALEGLETDVFAIRFFLAMAD